MIFANLDLRHRISATLLCLTLLLVATSPAGAENWTIWRGPRGDGTSLEMNIPTHWSATENIAWKVEVPGVGHSSPIIWGDRIFMETAIEHERVLLCFDRLTGSLLWKQVVLSAPLEHIHKLNSYASSTPATDGQRVYVSFLDEKEMYIAAYDFDGKRLWEARPGVFSSVHGYCSSPIIWKDTLIVNGDHDGPAYIVALNRATGETVWKTDRPNRTRSYCTPIIRSIQTPQGKRNEMMLSGSKSVASFDPDTGKQYWVIRGPTEQYVASLVYNGDLVFLTCGFPELHFMGIRPGGSGDVTDTAVAWHEAKTKHASYVPSPVAVGPYFLVVSDFGSATCFKAATGDVLWREKLGRHFAASLVEAGGLVYFTADQGESREEQGVTTVIRPGAALDIISKNVLGEPVYASPAISGGQLFIRGEQHLYCIGARAAE